MWAPFYRIDFTFMRVEDHVSSRWKNKKYKQFNSEMFCIPSSDFYLVGILVMQQMADSRHSTPTGIPEELKGENI